IGYFTLKSPEIASLSASGGRLIAHGELADALSNQLAADQPDGGPVRVSVSFKAKSGAYCRTFVLQETQALGGLACNENGTWNVRTLASIESPAGTPATA